MTPTDMRIALCTLALALLFPVRGMAEDAPDQKLNYQEVFDLLKSQLSDFDETAMGDVAARSLIQKLQPRVQLIEADSTEAAGEAEEARLHTRVFKEAFGSLRLTHLSPEDALAAKAALEALQETNRLKGLIVDLRFAEGTDYQAATDLADAFFAQPKPLADWGNGMVRSTEKTNAVALPTVVLINDQTAGGPELLTAILREGKRSLVIGTTSAGQASMYQDFKLASGQHLRVATAPIKVGEETLLDSAGVQPDIAVDTDPSLERTWLEDPFYQTKPDATMASADGATAPRRRLNEADLVRMLREGDIPEEFDEPATVLPAAATGPLIQDPVLARAIDFLKGLSLVRQYRAE